MANGDISVSSSNTAATEDGGPRHGGASLRRRAIIITAMVASLGLAFGAFEAVQGTQRATAASVQRASWAVQDPVNPNKVLITGGTSKERSLIRSYLKKWAKNTHILSLKIGKCAHSGTTTMYLTGASSICITQGLKGKPLQYVVAHETGHAAQMFAYRGMDVSYDLMESRLAKVFGGGPNLLAFDNAADCAARAFTGFSTYNHYKKNFTAAQLKAVKMVNAGVPI